MVYTSICKKLHGKLLERFIINARTDRYNIMCYVDSYEIEHQSFSCDYGIIGGGCPVATNSTTESSNRSVQPYILLVVG